MEYYCANYVYYVVLGKLAWNIIQSKKIISVLTREETTARKFSTGFKSPPKAFKAVYS